MTIYTASQWILFFYIYCFCGWIWESAYVSVCERKPVNRGFLKGPFLPIYGSGAICILIVTIPVRGNIPAMCIVGMVAATVLEYVTGYVMECLFKVRYWDYTGKFLNVNGYICLMSTICWGVMTVLVVDVIHVQVEKLVLAIDIRHVDILVMIMTPLITADFVTSFIAAIHLRDLLEQKERVAEEMQKLLKKKEELEEALANAGEKAKDQIRKELRELYISAGAKKESMLSMYSGSVKSVRGLLKRNPTAVSPIHSEAFAELKRLKNFRLEEVIAKANERFNALMSGAGEKLDEYRTERREKKEEKREERREKLGEVKEELKEKYDRK